MRRDESRRCRQKCLRHQLRQIWRTRIVAFAAILFFRCSSKSVCYISPKILCFEYSPSPRLRRLFGALPLPMAPSSIKPVAPFATTASPSRACPRARSSTAKAPEYVYKVMSEGAMMVQASGLNEEERRTIARATSPARSFAGRVTTQAHGGPMHHARKNLRARRRRLERVGRRHRQTPITSPNRALPPPTFPNSNSSGLSDSPRIPWPGRSRP